MMVVLLLEAVVDGGGGGGGRTQAQTWCQLALGIKASHAGRGVATTVTAV